jgi:hypothetical protein
MTRVALKGLLGRKVRAVLTALAIVLGVAMVSGSFVLTDTISKAFTSIFSSAYEKTDVVVSGKKLVDFSSGGNATVSQAVLDKIRNEPSVAAGWHGDNLNGDSTRAKLIGGRQGDRQCRADVRLRRVTPRSPGSTRQARVGPRAKGPARSDRSGHAKSEHFKARRRDRRRGTGPAGVHRCRTRSTATSNRSAERRSGSRPDGREAPPDQGLHGDLGRREKGVRRTGRHELHDHPRHRRGEDRG